MLSVRTWAKYKRLLFIHEHHLRDVRYLGNISNSIAIMEGGDNEYLQAERNYEKVNEKRKKSKKRYKNYMEKMFKSYYRLYWITITLDSAHVNQKTIKRSVNEFLKLNCFDFLCNIDYGEKKGRLHFHSICALKNMIDSSPFGRIDIREITMNERSKFLISKYANKLVNHALKSTAGLWWHPRGAKEVEIIPF